MTIREVFHHAKERTLPSGWLCLPSEGEWSLDTKGEILDGDEMPVIVKRKGLRETLDDGTIEEIVGWADRLADGEDDTARLDVFRYYFKFDAFPDRLGAPDPPPAEEIIRRLDREYYDSLGVERMDTKCRLEGCGRGTTRFSVFCKIHQFEQVKKKPCPFSD